MNDSYSCIHAYSLLLLQYSLKIYHGIVELVITVDYFLLGLFIWLAFLIDPISILQKCQGFLHGRRLRHACISTLNYIKRIKG